MAEARGPRRRAGSAVFLAALAAGLGAVYWLAPSLDVALAAGGAWVLFLLFLVAATDLAALATRSPRYLAWLPEWQLPPWLEPIRTSFVAVAFLYGILLGHYYWQ